MWDKKSESPTGIQPMSYRTPVICYLSGFASKASHLLQHFTKYNTPLMCMKKHSTVFSVHQRRIYATSLELKSTFDDVICKYIAVDLTLS